MKERVTSGNHDIKEIARLEKGLRYVSTFIRHNGRKILKSYTITPPQFIACSGYLNTVI